MGYNKNPMYGSNKFDNDSLSQVLHSDKASEITHTNSTDAAFLNSYSIPANALEKGDVIRVRLRATVTDNNSTDTLTPVFKFGGTAIATGAALDVADSDIIWVDAEISVTAIGASGTMTAHSSIKTNTGDVDVFATTALTSKDSTAAIVLGLEVDWSVAHAENIVRLDSFIVEIL
tara:strand:- start:234 stop:758 length:525 start_codon:yes stop_codon:yes gene_type:complete